MKDELGELLSWRMSWVSWMSLKDELGKLYELKVELGKLDEVKDELGKFDELKYELDALLSWMMS